MKKIIFGLMAMIMAVALIACSSSESIKTETESTIKNAEDLDISQIAPEEFLNAKEGKLIVVAENGEEMEILFNPILSQSFEEIQKEAKGSTVTFYGWGGDEDLNRWLREYYVPRMKEKYDINVQVVPMNIDEILSQLSGEKQANPVLPLNENDNTGAIDMVWINGENFKSASENQMLLDNYSWKLPNVNAYMDPSSPSLLQDFGYPIKNREVPYGEAQMVMYTDTALTGELPSNTQELLEFAKKYKGKVTYPAPPDFTGSAFVRNVIYDIQDWEQFAQMPQDKATVKAAIEPSLAYLRELNPYLWNEGKTFPSSSSQMENMFGDKELYFGMSYAAYGVAVNIENKRFPKTTQSFVFHKGMVGNTNYIAIPLNAPNKAGAIVAINEMVSPQVQADRFSVLKTLPVVDYNLLTKEEQQAFDQVEIGKGVIPQEELQSKKLPEMPAGLVPIIEEIWLEEVVGK